MWFLHVVCSFLVVLFACYARLIVLPSIVILFYASVLFLRFCVFVFFFSIYWIYIAKIFQVLNFKRFVVLQYIFSSMFLEYLLLEFSIYKFSPSFERKYWWKISFWLPDIMFYRSLRTLEIFLTVKKGLKWTDELRLFSRFDLLTAINNISYLDSVILLSFFFYSIRWTVLTRSHWPYKGRQHSSLLGIQLSTLDEQYMLFFFRRFVFLLFCR